MEEETVYSITATARFVDEQRGCQAEVKVAPALKPDKLKIVQTNVGRLTLKEFGRQAEVSYPNEKSKDHTTFRIERAHTRCTEAEANQKHDKMLELAGFVTVVEAMQMAELRLNP